MSASWREHLSVDADGRMRISKHGGMLTDALLIADAEHLAVHTDDRSPDKETNSTFGKKFTKLQTDNFKTNYQPYFCIINYRGKVISDIGYTKTTEEFVEFLNKGLK